MLKYQDVRRVHLEVTTHCNARCPLCVRNLYGADHNFGYPLTSLSLSDIQKIFPVDFVQQLNVIHFGGNFGDFIMAKDIIGIVEYLRASNPTLEIMGSTNAGIRPPGFWEKLASLDMRVIFCIDGIGETHSLYRIDTEYETVLENAKTFIKAGGRAIWIMTKFDHNVHQIDEARAIAKDLKFSHFEVRDQGRDNGPVLSRNGEEKLYYIGQPSGLQVYNKSQLIEISKQNFLKEHSRLINIVPATKFNCEVTQAKSIYVDASGDVYPCCFLGHYPRTYESSRIPGNSQIKDMLGDAENNALTHGIEYALGWFDKVGERFNVPTFEEGRLYICHSTCGIDK